MIRLIFLYNAILCIFMLILNFKKVGLKNKTCFIPSTYFWGIWLLSSLGCFLFANGILSDNDFFKYAINLDVIGYYQLILLIVCAFAFLCARISTKSVSLQIANEADIFAVVSKSVVKLRWLLYMLFFVGMLKLISVLAVTGFDYHAMRANYIETRGSSSSFEIWFERLGLYLLQANRFYICLLGLYAALKGLNVGKTIREFLLFSPFQMSYGGRLFILSFFMPFFVGYLIGISLFTSRIRKKDLKKFVLLLAIPLSLIVIVQSFKLDVDVEKEGFGGQIGQIFYSASIYQFLDEFFIDIDITAIKPTYGRCCLSAFFGPSPQLTALINYWADNHRSAAVCVPSMIPDLLLDFGLIGSYLAAFVMMFCIERYALKSLGNLNIKKFFIYIMLCLICFGSGTSSVGDSVRSLIVALIIITLIDKILIKRIR